MKQYSAQIQFSQKVTRRATQQLPSAAHGTFLIKVHCGVTERAGWNFEKKNITH